MTKTWKSIALAALLSVPFGPSAASALPKHSVYVSVSTEDASEATPRELSDSAGDLREQIGKRSNLVLAEHPEAAEISITILDRYIEVRAAGQTSYGGGSIQSYYQSRYILRYRLESGSFAQDGEYVLAGAFVTWKRMATGVSKDIEHWVEEAFQEPDR